MTGGFTENAMRFLLWKTICAAAMCAPLVAIAQQQPSDYAREKRWADEILPSIVSGEPVWLEAPRTEKFLRLHPPAKNAERGTILAQPLTLPPHPRLPPNPRTHPP